MLCSIAGIVLLLFSIFKTYSKVLKLLENQKVGHRKDCFTAILDAFFISVALDGRNSASVAKNLSNNLATNSKTVNLKMQKNQEKGG